MNRPMPVSSKISKLKNKTKILVAPWIGANFNNTNVITVTEIASTAKNPTFMPNTRKSSDIISPESFAWKMLEMSIFSVDAKRGTLNIAFARNKKNREIETVFTWFCRRGNRKSMALPKIIPWKIPIPNALTIATTENIGFWNNSTKYGTSTTPRKLSRSQY